MVQKMVRASMALGLLGLLVGLGVAVATAAEPVNYKQLLGLVDVKLQGWERQGDPKGNTVKTPQMAVTEVEAHYQAGDKNLEIKIVDSSLGQMAYMGMGFMQGVEVDSSEESTKGIKIKDCPGVETFRPQDKEAKVTILVANRFLVALEGNNFTDIKELRQIAEQLDMAKLAALAK